MNRWDIVTDLGMRIAFMAAVYGVFAIMLPSYRTVSGVAALLDGAVLIGVVAVGVGITMSTGVPSPCRTPCAAARFALNRTAMKIGLRCA